MIWDTKHILLHIWSCCKANLWTFSLHVYSFSVHLWLRKDLSRQYVCGCIYQSHDKVCYTFNVLWYLTRESSLTLYPIDICHLDCLLDIEFSFICFLISLELFIISHSVYLSLIFMKHSYSIDTDQYQWHFRVSGSCPSLYFVAYPAREWIPQAEKIFKLVRCRWYRWEENRGSR